MYKRVIALVGGFIFILGSFTGCKSEESLEQESITIKVGITMYNEFDPFTEDIRRNIEESLADLGQQNGVEITTTVVYSGKNQWVQNDQVEDFIEKDYDVVCVNLVDRTDTSVIIEKAKSTDTPIIFFNRELVEDDLNRYGKLYYVGANSEESGIIQGQIVIDALNERMDEIDVNQDGVIQYVLLEGEAGHQDAIIRSRVSVETITNAGFELEQLGDEIANWDRQQAKTKINSLLQGYPRQIELIIANDDNMAMGAVDAMEDFGVLNMPLIVGVNGQLECLEMIKKGLIEGTAFNNAKEKGKIIAQLSYDIILNEAGVQKLFPDGQKCYYVPYETITVDNADSYFN